MDRTKGCWHRRSVAVICTTVCKTTAAAQCLRRKIATARVMSCRYPRPGRARRPRSPSTRTALSAKCSCAGTQWSWCSETQSRTEQLLREPCRQDVRWGRHLLRSCNRGCLCQACLRAASSAELMTRPPAGDVTECDSSGVHRGGTRMLLSLAHSCLTVRDSSVATSSKLDAQRRKCSGAAASTALRATRCAAHRRHRACPVTGARPICNISCAALSDVSLAAATPRLNPCANSRREYLQRTDTQGSVQLARTSSEATAFVSITTSLPRSLHPFTPSTAPSTSHRRTPGPSARRVGGAGPAPTRLHHHGSFFRLILLWRPTEKCTDAI